MNCFPENTNVAVRWSKIIRCIENPALSGRTSSRMVKIAAHLPENEFVGWQMTVPFEGLAKFEVFGSAAVKTTDLLWISEETAKTTVINNLADAGEENMDVSSWNLYEIHIPVKQRKLFKPIGFALSPSDNANECENRHTRWPTYFSKQFGEFFRVLRTEGAIVRYSAGRATPEEQRDCEKTVMSTWSSSNVNVTEYIGLPVRAKTLLLIPNNPSARLFSTLDILIPGAELLHIGNLSHINCRQVWENPLSYPRVLPDIAARILVLEPFAGDDHIIGIDTCASEANSIPAEHQNSMDKQALLIGKAPGTSGLVREITIGDADLRRHWQIIGQTGTGKSTLLAETILETIKSGRGVTLLDPHGSTVDAILNSIPPKYADRVRLVRIGDSENPVPINMWQSDIAEDCEKTINDLNLLFVEIFDPKHDGIVGPRWERWFSVFASAAISLLGKKASFDSIITLSQNKENMQKLYRAILRRNPKAAQAIKAEYIDNNSNDFGDLVNWCVCKFQRLTAIKQLRDTLGAGTNALDFEHSIDTNTVTLIDLAKPIIGTNASRVIGTLLLLQLWNALMARADRNKTHVIAIDEAHLFQTNPLPQMLAEGRKFGVAMILVHQHCGQLSPELRDSLDANSANFSAFRLSVRDALEAVNKFDDSKLHSDLCRLNAFNAITTLSVDGYQTPAFTLQVEKLREQLSGKAVATDIERKSIETLVNPYRSCCALTSAEVMRLLEHRSKYPLPPCKESGNNTPSQPKHLEQSATNTTVPPLMKKLRDLTKKDGVDEAI